MEKEVEEEEIEEDVERQGRGQEHGILYDCRSMRLCSGNRPYEKETNNRIFYETTTGTVSTVASLATAGSSLRCVESIN